MSIPTAELLHKLLIAATCLAQICASVSIGVAHRHVGMLQTPLAAPDSTVIGQLVI